MDCSWKIVIKTIGGDILSEILEENVQTKDLAQEDKKKAIEEWLSTEKHDILDIEDVGKEGVITDYELKDTRFGKRLALYIQIDDKKKVLFLSKVQAKKVLEEVNSIDDLIGRKIKIVLITIQVRNELIEKPFIKII